MKNKKKKFKAETKIDFLQTFFTIEYNENLKLRDRIDKTLLFLQSKIKENIDCYENSNFEDCAKTELINLCNAFKIEIERQFDIILNGDNAAWFTKEFTFEDLISNGFAGEL